MRIWNVLTALVYNAINNGMYNGFFSLISYLLQWALGNAPSIFAGALKDSNLAGTYSNGTAGAGATLTKASAGALGSIDGVTPQLGMTVLLTAQTSGFQNGIYQITNLGSTTVPWVLTRWAGQGPSNSNPWNVSANMVNGSAFFIQNGTVYGGQVWAYVGANLPTVGTTSLAFARDYLLRSSSNLNAGLPVFGALAKTSAVLANSPVYDNGTAGVGATLTSTGNHAVGTVGGISITVVGTVLLVTEQASAFQNGLYVVTTVGGAVPYVLTRLPGFDTAATIKDGTLVAIQQGTSAGLLYEQTATVAVVGTDDVTFALAATGVTLAAVNTALATGQAVFTHTGWPLINNAADTFGTTLGSLATAARATNLPDLAGTLAVTGQATGAPSATSAPAFTGTTPLGAVNYATPAFSGTGGAGVGQVFTTTDTQTMPATTTCAGMLFCTATQGPFVIASNTIVAGAPAVLTFYGAAPATDAGTYKIFRDLAPVGTVAAVPTTTHTHTNG